jgi:glycosyltransferase involved in cell wall biosynthesis
VFIGRIAEDTGAKVYEKVLGQMPGVTLDIYGEGSKLGTVADSCSVFPKYDIACVSSYLAIIEAMQSKTLVIAYAANELKYDYLMAHPRAKDMYIVRNENELRETIISLDDRTHEMIENAYEWARQQTWNRVYKKYLKLWKLG